MLAHLTTAFTLGLIFINTIGLALVTYRALGSYALARVASPLVLALVTFFLEHFVGFGRLDWVWPLTTAASAWIVLRHADVLRMHWKLELVFLLSFGWVFAWRFSYPGLVASSEKIGDLAMIVSYLPGDRLPPLDAWYPPYTFDIYYSFQHYAAALLGRIFDLSPGLAYNLGFSLLVALTAFAGAVFAYAVCKSARWATLVAVAFAAGGTGASVPVHFMMNDPQLHSSMRFIGGTATPKFVQTSFGRSIVAVAGATDAGRTELPAETFAYMLSLGDYHPPLSGFYLLALALLCMAAIENGTAARPAQAVLAATPVVCTVANGWSLPLQFLLVATWVAYRLRQRRPPDWGMLAAGFLVAAVLCHAYLGTFAYRSADYALHLRLVPVNQRTPWLLGLIQFYPVLMAILLPLLFGERKTWILWSSGLWLGLAIFSEVFYIDDIYSGPFNRFNTTLKWWPWIQAGVLLTAGAYGVRSRSRVLRYGTVVALTAVSLFAFDMIKGLATGVKRDFGRIEGTAWITDDRIERAIFEFLKAQPRSIVLQRLEAGAFTPAPGIILLAGQTAFMGWPEHEKLWRGYRADIDLRAAQVAAFYAGELPDPADWLLQNRIDHVLWLKTEGKVPAGTFDKIDASIRHAYYWREYYRAGEFRVGVWSRRVAAAAAVSSGQ